MRTVERIGFVLVLFCTITLLERAGAQDGLSGMSEDDAPARTSGALSTSDLKITAPDGRVVMRLSAAASGGGQIRIYNRSGKTVLNLYSRTDQCGEMVLYDARGSQRVGMAAKTNAGFANYYGLDGKIAVYVGAGAKRSAGVVDVYDRGQARATLSAEAKGGLLSIHNDKSKISAYVGTTSNTGIGMMRLYDATGQLRMLCEGATQAGSFQLRRSGGSSVVSLGSNASRGGYLLINNGLGKRAAFLGSSTGKDSNEGILEVTQPNGKLGVVARAYRSGPYVTVYDTLGRAKKTLR